jgi:Flp pilus assembly protein TadD
LRQASELAPADPQILCFLGMVLALEKKLEESSVIFQKANELVPDDATVRR